LNASDSAERSVSQTCPMVRADKPASSLAV